MSEPTYKKQREQRDLRLPLVIKLLQRGYTRRQIQAEVKKRLNLASYSLGCVSNDIQYMLKEFRETRLNDTKDYVQLELSRIDATIRELWQQWEKSKEDYQRITRNRKGAPKKDAEGINTYSVEESQTNIVGLGNVAYISEIRKQLEERRKLLGLYAPEKIEETHTFAELMLKSMELEDCEESAK